MICKRSFLVVVFAIFVRSTVVQSRSTGATYLTQSLQNLQESLQNAQNGQAGNSYAQGNPAGLAQQLNLANLAGVAGAGAPSSDLVDTYDSLEHLHQDILKSGLYQNEPYPAASSQRQQVAQPNGGLVSVVQQPQPQAAALAQQPASLVQQAAALALQPAALALQQLQTSKAATAAAAAPSALEKAILDFLMTERILKFDNGRFVPDDQGLL